MIAGDYSGCAFVQFSLSRYFHVFLSGCYFCGVATLIMYILMHQSKRRKGLLGRK